MPLDEIRKNANGRTWFMTPRVRVVHKITTYTGEPDQWGPLTSRGIPSERATYASYVDARDGLRIVGTVTLPIELYFSGNVRGEHGSSSRWVLDDIPSELLLQ